MRSGVASDACPCDVVHLPQPNFRELVLKALVRSAMVESHADTKAWIVGESAGRQKL